MSRRATRRPATVSKPAHWTNEPPPRPAEGTGTEGRDPTRYGDWEKGGLAIDF